MANIVDIVSSVRGTDFVGMDTQVTVKLTGGKSNPQQGRVEKVMKGASVMIFQNGGKEGGYARQVRRRLEREGKDAESFKLSPRKWGERMLGLPIVTHKGNLYLEVIFLKAGKVTYLLDGLPVDKSQIQGLPESRGAQQGGLEDKVQIRTFKVSSLTALRINHEEHTNITQ